jgi:hypothetical protein
MECHMSNISYMIYEILPGILWYVFFSKKLVALNLDFSNFIYGTSTNNTCLRLVLGLFTNPTSIGYLRNYNEPKPEICITSTSLCLLRILKISQSETSQKKIIAKFQDDSFETDFKTSHKP